ncbi:hypothetical protein ADN00_16250 [Ornatilinea apprima]|uniref:Uncharacterized protein n=1 Tax=Ornatilinea apprima TaxID=1134406 RepID=A0A0P6WPP5_9CHLR|nr:hypothetical protein [Ornatilinea apprima]KPL72036.1 hypothetical protein ADN00_16250 [Ornatilinea apprima]
MNDILLNLIVLVVFAALGLLLFIFLQNRKKQKDAQFIQMAKEKGWEVERIQQPLLSGYRVRGRNTACEWTIESLAEASPRDAGPGSSEVGLSTRWWTKDVALADRGLVFGPVNNPGDAQMLASMGGAMFSKVIHGLLGEDADWAADLALVNAGSDQFRQKYLCLASEKEDAIRVLQPGIEKLMLALADRHRVVIKLTPAGLEIRIPTEQMLDRTSLDLMVNLGTAIVEIWLGSR